MRILGIALFTAALGLAVSCAGRGGAPPAAPVDVTVADVADAGASVAIAPP